MGKKIYLEVDTYTAVQRRLQFIFEHFDNVYVSFSGGKDSGLLLNLVLSYMRANGITKKIGVFHQDFEAQYTETTRYVERVMTSNLDLIEPFWECLPKSSKTATSMYEQYWIPWDPAKQDIWVRPMPEFYGVINVDNNPFDFFTFGMMQEDVYREFGPWYHRVVCGSKGRTIGLIGIRSDESLNRWRAASTERESSYLGANWTSGISENVWCGYPLYDWPVEDIWTANAKFGYDYNKLYDLMHAAGLSVHEMRVASPFHDWAISTLKLYRVLEPNIWARMVGRVNGANFTAIYGGTDAVAWKNIKLPPGHTWKTYAEFLLSTLPEDTRNTYLSKIEASKKSWKVGGARSPELIEQLIAEGAPVIRTGETNNRGKGAHEVIRFDDYLDDTGVDDFRLVPTWKRLVICILKNDHLCKYMGFAQTKREVERKKAIMEKYANL